MWRAEFMQNAIWRGVWGKNGWEGAPNGVLHH